MIGIDPLKDAATSLRLALEHPSLFALEELIEKAETFIKAGRKALATERRNNRRAARIA